MSKNLENIEVEVNEREGFSKPTWEVVIPGKEKIGLIEQSQGRFQATSAKSNNVLCAKSLEAAINDLLSYYALHEK